MEFTYTPTIPINTDPDNPITEELPVAGGRVSQVQVVIPAGHEGLAGMRLYYRGSQVWPYSIGEWFRGNATNIRFNTEIKIDQPPFFFVFEGYNEDTVNDHGFEICIQMFSELEEPMEAIRDSLQEISTRGNWASDEFYQRVQTRVVGVEKDIRENLLPDLNSVIEQLKGLRQDLKEPKSMQDLARV